MDDLVKELTKKLGVNRKQAQGGLVAILRAGKQNLSTRISRSSCATFRARTSCSRARRHRAR